MPLSAFLVLNRVGALFGEVPGRQSHETDSLLQDGTWSFTGFQAREIFALLNFMLSLLTDWALNVCDCGIADPLESLLRSSGLHAGRPIHLVYRYGCHSAHKVDHVQQYWTAVLSDFQFER